MQRFSFYFLSRTSLSFDVKLKRGGGAIFLQIGVLVAPDTGFETQHWGSSSPRGAHESDVMGRLV